MSTGNSRANEDHLHPFQRRRAVILLLATALGRMVGPEPPPKESAESCEKVLGTGGEIRP